MPANEGDPLEVRYPAVNDEASNPEIGDIPSLLDQAFEGWQLMAEAASEADPQVAGLMSSGALLARTAFERQIGPFLTRLRSYLEETDLMPQFQDELIEGLDQRLSVSPSPFKLEWLIEQHKQAVNGFTADRPEMADSGNGLSLEGVAKAAILWPLIPDPAASAASHSVRQEWRVLATVEQPGKIGQDGSLYCSAPSSGWRKHVRLEESTYQRITHTSRPVGEVADGKWVALMGEEVERDFNAHEPTGFGRKIKDNIDGTAYLLRLHLGGNLKPLSYKFIEQHKGVIRDFADDVVEAARKLIPPLALVPAPVLKVIPSLILLAIEAILKDRIGDKTLPSWLIQHTVMRPPGQAPISAVLLRSPEQPEAAKATLAGTQFINGKVEAATEYPNTFPVAQLWPRGRIIDGATRPENSTDPFPREIPESLWDWCAKHERPVVWSDSWEEEDCPVHAFRVLIPFYRLSGIKPWTKRTPQSYVAALRVEVYPVPHVGRLRRPPPIISPS